MPSVLGESPGAMIEAPKIVTLLFTPLKAKLKLGEFLNVTPVIRTLVARVNWMSRGRAVMRPLSNAVHQAEPSPSITPLPVMARLEEPEAKVIKWVLGFG